MRGGVPFVVIARVGCNADADAADPAGADPGQVQAAGAAPEAPAIAAASPPGSPKQQPKHGSPKQQPKQRRAKAEGRREEAHAEAPAEGAAVAAAVAAAGDDDVDLFEVDASKPPMDCALRAIRPSLPAAVSRTAFFCHGADEDGGAFLYRQLEREVCAVGALALPGSASTRHRSLPCLSR